MMDQTNLFKVVLFVLIVFGCYSAFIEKDEHCFPVDFFFGVVRGTAWIAVLGAVFWSIGYILTA
jgi:hypothetical protein